MSIVLARIDNRLIHGQVLESWVPSLHADCIVVANDEAAANAFQRMIMSAAVPRSIRVEIGTLRQVADLFAGGELERRRVLLLFATTPDARRAHGLGIPFAELNLGNLHAGSGKMRVSCTISLAREDIDNLASLEEAGVRITSQCVPADREQYWRRMIPAQE